MSNPRSLQSFEQLFEKINFKKGQAGRSVYSPAAYLADLIQLLEDKFGASSDFFNRRGDVKDIKLNGENAFSQIAYLDIVNRILERKIGGENPYEVLKNSAYPLHLPFSLDEKKYQRYLKFLDLDPAAFYKTFTTEPNKNIIAREYLKLSDEAVAMITEDLSQNNQTFFKRHFNLDNDYHNRLSDLESFLTICEISLQDCFDLIYQKLSKTGLDAGGNQQSELDALASNSFINHGLTGYAFLNENETKIDWGEIGEVTEGGTSFSLTHQGIERLHRASRLIRLSKKTGISILDLELVIRTVCGNQLDKMAIQKLAVVKMIHDKFDLPIDACCAFFANMNVAGLGNENEPADLFNRTFNNDFSSFDNKYILGSAFIPEAFTTENGHQMMWAKGDLLSVENTDYRKRVEKALHISSRDLELIVQKFRMHFGEASHGQHIFETTVDDARPALDVLYRLSNLTSMLDCSYEDIFHLFDLLEKDESLQKFGLFATFIPFVPHEKDAYQIIQGKAERTTEALFWLTQLLIGLVTWMQDSDWTGAELKKVLTGQPANGKAAGIEASQKLEFLNTFYQQLKSQFFKYQNFNSTNFKTRAARSIYRAVSHADAGLVSSRDHRLVRFDKMAVQKASEKAIQNLPIFTKEDFQGLGIEEKMIDKIFNNLVIKGYINSEGGLIEAAFPGQMEDFKINNSSSDEKAVVFKTIQDLVKDVFDENNGLTNGDRGEVTVFLSDFEELEIPEDRTLELYDNLMFNGYVDEEGNLIHPDFFIDDENQEEFEPNANIDIYSAKVYKKIKAKIDCFYTEKLIIKPDDFSDLPLVEVEMLDLMENLRFNDYLNDENAIADKKQLLELGVDDLNIAIQFYPYRKQILAKLQSIIADFKTAYFTVTKEMLAAPADEMVAEMIYRELENTFLKDGKINDAGLAFFKEEENLAKFYITPYFTPIFHQTIFKNIQEQIADFQAYELNLSDLETVDLADEYGEDVLEFLEKEKYITNGNLNASQRDYFLNINNALSFDIESYSDYSKDVFFLLHNIAKKTAESVSTIQNIIQTVAKNQREIAIAALGEYAELSPETAEVVLSHLYINNPNWLEALVLPILQQVDEKDRITAVPDNFNFNISLQRLKQAALLISKLRLSKAETSVVFADQGLAEKLPEKLHLPAALQSFDALLELDNQIYIFKDHQYWTYNRSTYLLEEEVAQPRSLNTLSENFATITEVHAAFTDPSGNAWLIGGIASAVVGEGDMMWQESVPVYFKKNKGEDSWNPVDKIIGKVHNNFDAPEKIDATFVDDDGKIFLFSGDQYMRYSEAMVAEEGYPKLIKNNWKNELDFDLPAAFAESIDASFMDADEVKFLVKDNEFISSDDYSNPIKIKDFWGKIKNDFESASRIDSAFVYQNKIYFTTGEQIIAYQDSIENDDVAGTTGSLEKLTDVMSGLPNHFDDSIDAVLTAWNDVNYIFKGKKYTALDTDFGSTDEASDSLIESKWGLVDNTIAETGRVDAAMAGLDGRTYLFSGTHFYRYSKANYAKVDEGYPKTIATHWGGLSMVDAAFVLNGKTYLFGKDANYESIYLQYSTNDYTTPDEGFPKPVDDNWWNLPEKLLTSKFDMPDAVFVGNDKKTYLFKDDQFITYDNQHRWWSEPEPFEQKWDILPFGSISAAFTGKDGRTYIFEKSPKRLEEDLVLRDVESESPAYRFIRYTDKNYNKVDDRYPKSIKDFWGNVVNNFQKNKTVDAAVTLVSNVITANENGEEVEEIFQHTYLFSGNQFIRYTGNQYDTVDEGYPKKIETGLKEEPRFKNLKADFSKGIDAIFADSRNVYLFKEDQLVVISEETTKVYKDILEAPISTALIDGGSIYGMNSIGWSQLGAVENGGHYLKSALPPVLRNIPEDFQTEVDAVLKGVDKNTYVFKNGICYNETLDKQYPIGEEWGRTRNLFQINGTIDAGFVGSDGTTYLFSGDQFVSYTNDATHASAPKRIADHWAGLTNVNLAFIKDGKTYLMEAPDEDGIFRYLCYGSDDYTHPDSVKPMEADFSWWEIPEDYIEDGFDTVQAVLFDDENMYLLNEDSFIQYHLEDEMWTFSKPFQRIWRNFPEGDDNFKSLKTAFVGNENIIHFFAENTFIDYPMIENGAADKSIIEIKDIKSHWGIENNNIVQQNKIDAAVVVNNKTTYLFSGDQYVRYSEEDYEFVDEGYPKMIVDHLRYEKGFENLTVELEKTLGDSQSITAILANAENIYIFENGHCHVWASAVERTYPSNRIGQLKNNIAATGKIDAGFRNQADELLLFSGDQYVKYSTTDYDFVDQGYPKFIKDDLQNEVGFANLNGFLDYHVDAIFGTANGNVYCFNGGHYADSNSDGARINIRGVWGAIYNQFDSPNNSQPAIDAAFTAPDGKTYFFKNNQYLCYSDLENEFADEGYPKFIQDNWGDLFPGFRNQWRFDSQDFESKIDGAWTLAGHTYFSKGDQYVRYSNSDFTKMDSIFPEYFNAQWTDRNDFLLNDLKVISRYKTLTDQYQGGEVSLTDFFYEGVGYQKMPFEFLANIFDWNVDEIKWLKQRNVFIRPENETETQFDLELVLGLYDIFELAKKSGASPSTLYEKVWLKKYADDIAIRNIQVANDTLYTQFGLNNSEADWKILSRQIHDEMNLIRRDALMPYLIEMTSGVNDARDLFEQLLIDVEMGSDAKTSNIKEATAAVQLYFHRYLVNLEEADDTNEEKKEELKSWWKWMKNYRVWEANRKVFLYPENYIRPELRDTKTPEFKMLEDALIQGIIDQESVVTNYKKYIDNFSIVGNLKIAGANVYKDKGEDVLILFGHARTEPHEYYYRTARFEGDVAEWGAWEKTELTINSDRVFPLYANGRIMVFWIEIEDYEDAKGALKQQGEDSKVLEVNTNNTSVRHRAHVKYSFYDLNKRWSPPQNIKRNLKLNYKLDAAYVEKDKDGNNQIRLFTGEYCLSSSIKNPAGDIKFIEEYEEYKHLPANFKLGVDSITTIKGHRLYFKGRDAVVQKINSPTDVRTIPLKSLIQVPEKSNFVVVSINWFGVGVIRAVDHGEKLDYKIPDYFDAAFTIEDEIVCLIDKDGKYVFFEFAEIQEEVSTRYVLTPVQTLKTIHERLKGINFEFFMQTLANKGGQFAPADGVFKDDKTYYVLRNGMYECYEIGAEGLLKAKEGFPKAIRGNLAFNMDKFFNRMHLVWNENGDKHINLNYTTSRGDLMLFGKISPDFIFEEKTNRNNLGESFLHNWKRYLADSFISGYDSSKGEAASAFVGRVEKGINELATEIKFLKSVTDGNQHMIIALNLFENPTQFNAEIDKAIGLLNSVDTSVPVWNDIKRFATSLKSDFNSEETSIEHLESVKEEILDYQRNSVSNEITIRINTLKTIVSQSKEALFSNEVQQLNAYYDALIFTSKRLNSRIRSLSRQLGESSFDLVLPADSLYAKLSTTNNSLRISYNKIVQETNDMGAPLHDDDLQLSTKLSTVNSTMSTVLKTITTVKSNLTKTNTAARKLSSESSELMTNAIGFLSEQEEFYFGKFDLFHRKSKLGITDTTSNFSFGLVDWYVFEKEGGTFLCRPRGKSESDPYEIIRLTTNTASELSRTLFVNGIEGLLSLRTQKMDESPAFGKDEGEIQYNTKNIHKGADGKDSIPTSANLDFEGANANYYWELFFHAPFLIAQALNNAQKFDEAKEWYEYIFDPTKNNPTTALNTVWQFLPFADANLENNFISNDAQLKKYYNDPFDPHAIAGLRINAYRKSIVMNYIDNLLDWGDMLFRQYTMESINEARMLYVLAYDLLGKKPQSAGNRILSPDETYQEQSNSQVIDLEIWDLENEMEVTEESTSETAVAKPLYTIHDSNLSAYFFIPENELFLEYWDRVEDRLYKIRQSLNIKGIKEPLPLFQPPIDPMALVLAASSGAGISAAMSSLNVAVPHYRFNFMINKAKELINQLNQFGGELLSTIEKKDAEELSNLQNRQEGVIMEMSRAIRESQLTEAQNYIQSLEGNLADANRRLKYHEDTIETGFLPAEIGQIAMMSGAAAGHVVATVFNTLAVIAFPFPEVTIGPFSFGTSIDPGDLGEGLSKVGEAASAASEGLSILGEISGMVAQQERMQEDWAFQRDATKHEIEQMKLEIEGAKLQQKVAMLEIDIYEKEVEHQESIENFYKEKFSNQQLYQWMSGRLSGLYYQTYQLAYDMAKYAEKAFQYERGLPAAEANYIQPTYWNSQRKGLMAGESLGLDLDRMEKAFIETNERRLEISKNISLLELDPMAFLNLLKKGVCEFRLSEALFDYDFQGHYCRQIKTITLTITAGDGQTVNATLTQLNHSTIMTPDGKAVKFLLNPKGQQPLSIRNNWRSSQQIAISHVGEYDESNGLFELRFDDDRYLPFEGTGAISTWRLELNGKRGSYQLNEIKNVELNIKYTAIQGGTAFANTVKGLLKPYQTVHLIDFETTFANEWQEFLSNSSNDLTVTLTKDLLPNISSSKISGIMTKYILAEEGTAQFTVNQDSNMILKDGKYTETPGLSISSRGTKLTLTFKGNKTNLNNLKLVLSYKAKP